VYSITDAGRQALADWLALPGAGPTTEFEALMKVAFADNGSLGALRTNLAAIRAHAEAQPEYSEERRREYAESGGPFPDRLPVISLATRFYHEQNLAMLRGAMMSPSSRNSLWGPIPINDRPQNPMPRTRPLRWPERTIGTAAIPIAVVAASSGRTSVGGLRSSCAKPAAVWTALARISPKPGFPAAR
jgi:hypothetical protein